MTYNEDQVKAICLAFYNWLPQDPTFHVEENFDAWFERYGDVIAGRVDVRNSNETQDPTKITTRT